MDHEKGNTLKVYIKQYLNRYKGCFALVAGIMIFYIFTLYLCGVSAADIRYFAGLEIVFLVVSAVFCGIRYWYRMRTVKRQIRDYMQGMQTLSDTEDALEEVYMDALEQLQNKRQEEKGAYRNQQREMEEYYALWVHQIKTPISAMHLLIQSFEEQAMEFEEHAEETLDFLNEMKMKIFQTEEYVGMVLSYLRMEDMGNDLKFQWYPIGDIMRQAVRKYSQIFILKKIHLNFQDSRQMVLTDEKWLLFVIEQILSNALKYTSSDEVRPPKAGSISLYIKGTELVVEDTGIGIAPEDLPRIFERGFTGYNGREHQKSTGIGLYLCKTIIQKLGHSIRAESRVGVGTKIYISLEREDVKFE